MRAYEITGWRRRRDSNPRDRFLPVCTLSRGVPSATRPLLRTTDRTIKRAVFYRQFLFFANPPNFLISTSVPGRLLHSETVSRPKLSAPDNQRSCSCPSRNTPEARDPLLFLCSKEQPDPLTLVQQPRLSS